MKRRQPGETGAALLTVLILVGIMGAIAVGVFDRLRLATMLTGNAGGLEAARGFALVGEQLVSVRIDDLIAASPQRTTLAGGWQGRTITLPLPAGTARARVIDGSNCFNLNSLVTGTAPDALVSRSLAIGQFVNLMLVLDMARSDARQIAAAAADWIDSDDRPNADGAEDGAYAAGANAVGAQAGAYAVGAQAGAYAVGAQAGAQADVYAGAPQPYRTANTLMAEVSELRAVTGVTPALYARLRPWLCTLPVAELSPINVNTLLPAQAPLIAMLYGETLAIDAARRVIAERPAGGWPATAEFWNSPTLRDLPPPGEVLQQVRVTTRWFALDLDVDVGGTQLHETGLIDARQPPARIAVRRWTGDE